MSAPCRTGCADVRDTSPNTARVAGLWWLFRVARCCVRFARPDADALTAASQPQCSTYGPARCRLVAGEVTVTKRKLSTQILVSQLVILVATVLIGFALSARAERDDLDRQYRERALAIAKTVASVPLIREAMEYGDSGGAIQSTTERIRKSSGAAYVVVIDLQGIRHSHPTPALIGQPVEEPLVAVDYTGVDTGSLGLSANGKTPIYGPSGNLVGEVSAGILESEVAGALAKERPIFVVYFGVALALGAAASYLLAWRLKRSTFGLELHEFATLLQEREAMLHGIREGVIAFDRVGRVTVINDEARRLLGIGGAAGQPLGDLLPPGRLHGLLRGTG